MGEKKRRLAAGGRPKSSSDTKLDAQLTLYRDECQQLERATAAKPDHHEALYRLSVLRRLMSVVHRERADDAALMSENFNRALDAITRALWVHPESDAYWMHFADCIAPASLRYPLDQRGRDMLTHALEHPAVQPLGLVPPIVALLRSHPALPGIEKYLIAEIEIDAADAPMLLACIEEVFREPLLLQLLALTIVPEPMIERLIVLARGLVLRKTVESFAEMPPLPLAAIVAIAHQCFATEYVYDVSNEENSRIGALQDAIESRRASGAAVPFHWYALFACYRSLDTLAEAGRLPGLLDGTDLGSLLRTQVLEPDEERRLRATIPCTAVTDNLVSAAVGALYEAHPYPRWLKTVRIASEGGLREQLRQLRRYVTPPVADDSRPSILVAGCGTGQQSIGTAQRYRDARVLAIDLSLTSLAFAKRKTLELGLDNLEYRQCDILELSSLEERFDLIESIGVLHHLEDPLRGWRSLQQLLKPYGTMRIGLYSEIARRELIPLRQMVAEQGMKPDMEGIRRCRANLRSLLGSGSVSSLAGSPDLYCASGCRDMLFHVMEHRYTLPQIGTMLAQLDLEFLGLLMPTDGLADRYRAEFPDDKEMTNLDHLHQFEIANPWMFKGLCKFWVQARQ